MPSNRITRAMVLFLAVVLCFCALHFSASATEVARVVMPEEIQARIDAILTKHGITAEMTDSEIANAIAVADGDTLRATMDEMAAIEDSAKTLTEVELAELETELYGRFCGVMEQLQSPVTIAKDVSALDGNLTISDSQSNGKLSNGVYTATAKGGLFSAKTNTITITNNLESEASLSFKYNISSANSFNVDGDASNPTGTFSKKLSAGGTVTITIKSNSGLSNTTVTLKLENLSLTAVADSSTVTIKYDSSLGSVTAGGDVVANNGTVNVTSDGIVLTATPTSTSLFLGWIDTSNNAKVELANGMYIPTTETITLQAVFVPKASTATAWFLAGGDHLYDDLNAAASYASTASTKTVILLNSGTLASDDYTIPAGVTLLIPYNDANTLCKDKPSVHDNAYTNPSVYRALTMASGANITVNGAISVSGSQSSKYGHNSMPSGPLGFIKMNSGSKITVENGANLYVWGYITGSGSVEIKTGGTVHECFQIADYRGGDATSSITGKDDEYGVFPFNQYYLQNVEVPMTLYAGAKENGYGSVYVTLAGKQAMSIPFIGSSESMFIITSGYIVKDYMEGTGRTKIDVYGNLSITEVEIDMKVALIGDIKINTAKYALPIPHHFTVSVESGTITMNQSIAFLPGSELYIKEGATGTLGNGKKVYVYDLDQWLYNNGANGYSGTTNLPYVQTRYVPGGDGTTGRLKDALIQVDGTADLSAGAVYVTNGGANIYSTGTGVVKVASTKDAEAYQVITADTDISSWPVIAMQPAILQNGDDTDVATKEVAGTYTYCADTQKWCPPGHRYDDGAVSEPNCTEAGYTTYTCIACGETKTEAGDPALGHSWGNWSTGVCSVCDEKAIQFSAIQLSIESEIQLLLKFAVHQDLLTHASELTAYVTEEKNRIEPEDSWNKKVTDLPTDNGRYVVSQGIAAGEMTGLVTVQFKNGDAVIPVYDKATGMVGAVEKTVVSFAKAALAAEGEEGKNVALCKGALTFGGYAQQFYRTHTDNLAYSCFGETAPDVTVDSWDGFATTVSSTEGFSLIPTTQKINLDSKIDIRLYFEGESDDCSAELTRPINKGTATETVDIAFGNENGRVYLDIKDVPPAYWNDTYAITVSNDSESYTIRTSVLAWCARCDASATASDAQKAMARAMYHYANAADAYFAAKNAQ